VAEIFREYLEEKTSFLAIETDIMTDEYELNKPFLSELRVISL